MMRNYTTTRKNYFGKSSMAGDTTKFASTKPTRLNSIVQSRNQLPLIHKDSSVGDLDQASSHFRGTSLNKMSPIKSIKQS